MFIMIPVYLSKYGPTNFLYICDAALILTLIGLWTNNALFISMGAVGIIFAQSLWVVDLLGTFSGLKITGMTAYMFNSDTPIFLRSLSLFHAWLPFLLIYLVYIMGYDCMAFLAWTGLFIILMILSIIFTPALGSATGLTPSNINFVWGLRDGSPQELMPKALWLALLTIECPCSSFTRHPSS